MNIFLFEMLEEISNGGVEVQINKHHLKPSTPTCKKSSATKNKPITQTKISMIRKYSRGWTKPTTWKKYRTHQQKDRTYGSMHPFAKFATDGYTR